MSAQPTLAGILADRFERITPHEPMIRCKAGARDDRELIATSAAVAATLRSMQLGPGAHIGILSQDRERIVQAIIGIIAQECVFVPLDPSQPAERLAGIARTAGLSCILADDTAAGLAGNALGPDGRVVPIAGSCDAEAGHDLIANLRRARALPLYIYFTTGSAGEPKPVLGRSDSLLHFISWEIGTFGLGAGARIAQLTPPWHDPFLRDIFVPLACGGTVCIPPSPSIVVSPNDLLQWLEHDAIVLLHCTPTVFRNLAQARLASDRLPALRHILIAGEPLRGSHVSGWYDRMKDRIRLANLYGPTETTLAKLYHPMAPAESALPAIPIGTPLPDTTIRILAEADREAALGEVGELVIETRFASLGYFGRPAATAVAFSPLPGDPVGQPIAYRTGDLVKRLPDGSLQYVERIDRRQKLHGRQIDLGWIEDLILRRLPITACAAFVIASGGQTDRLALVYVADEEFDRADALGRLADTLARQDVPEFWVKVPALPTNHNGKLDGAALAALIATVHPEPEASQAAALPLAGQLAEIWQELLGVAEIDPDTTFVDLGGDSLAIMLLIARLESEFDYCLSLWDVFDDLTVQKLAGRMGEAAPRATHASHPGEALAW